jgi:hypothetical protein
MKLKLNQRNSDDIHIILQILSFLFQQNFDICVTF